jgi:hypothetical protein
MFFGKETALQHPPVDGCSFERTAAFLLELSMSTPAKEEVTKVRFSVRPHHRRLSLRRKAVAALVARRTLSPARSTLERPCSVSTCCTSAHQLRMLFTTFVFAAKCLVPYSIRNRLARYVDGK